MKKSTFAYLVIAGSIVFSIVNIQKIIPMVQGIIVNIKGGNNSQSYKEVKWQDLKGQLSSSEISVDVLNLISRVYLKDNEINEAIDIFDSSKNIDLRKGLFVKFSSSTQNPRVKDLVTSIAKSQDRQLSPIALRALISSETKRDSSNNDQWTTWQWSPEILVLLEDAVNQNMFRLSAFSYHQLLKLAERYPESMMTKGAIQYRNHTNGSNYFGYQNSTILRQPFNPTTEKNIWLKFIDMYPDHPGTDDAMFRIARSYEVLGEYQNAVLWYYKSSQAPDGGISSSSVRRIFLLTNSIMSVQEVSLLIEQLIQKQQAQNLIPYLEYGKALNLVNTGDLQAGHDAIDKFIKRYKQQGVRIINGGYLNLDSVFWNELERQVEDIKELQKILSQPKSDKRLYEEGAFWFNKKRLTYNFLEKTFGSSSLPVKWDGNLTYTGYSVTENLVNTFWEKHKSRNQLLKSVKAFGALLKEYPNSDLREKASYSIALSYYYLHREGWRLRDIQDSKNIAVQSFEKFISDFPESSMADDALISIAFLEVGEKNNKVKVIRILERQIQEYPNGDRIKEAKKMLEDIRNNK